MSGGGVVSFPFCMLWFILGLYYTVLYLICQIMFLNWNVKELGDPAKKRKILSCLKEKKL